MPQAISLWGDHTETKVLWLHEYLLGRDAGMELWTNRWREMKRTDWKSGGDNPQSFQCEAGQVGKKKGKKKQKQLTEPWRKFAIKKLLSTRLLGSFSEAAVAGATMKEPPLVSARRSCCWLAAQERRWIWDPQGLTAGLNHYAGNAIISRCWLKCCWG